MVMMDSAARLLFPRETWTRIATRVYLAGTRAAQGVKSNSERQKLQREVAQAMLLARYGHYVYLVPEAGRGKHYDAIVDGVATEFKEVTGNIDTLGKQYKAALRQGCNVFLRTRCKTRKEIYSKLIGETKILLRSGRVLRNDTVIWLWVDGDDELVSWRMSSIIKDASK